MDRERRQLGLADRDRGGVGAGVQLGPTRSPVRVRVEAMGLTTTSWLVSGRPRQFIVIWEHSRCWILFHCNDVAVVVVARV
jgi:hypothetical protein